MNTRHAAEDSAFRQEKFMSSPEMQRGLLANCVAARAQALTDPEQRKLIWFLQKLSWEPGGLDKVAAEIMQRWPERFVTESMAALGCEEGRNYSAEEVQRVRREIPVILSGSNGRRDGEFMLRGESSRRSRTVAILDDFLPDDDYSDRAARLANETAESAAFPECYPASIFIERCRNAAENHFREFLFESLCLDPAVKLNARTLWYLPRLVETLAELHAEHVAAALGRAPVTEIGATVGETLDYALDERCLVVIDGLARTGKTFSVRQWCDAHPGQSRYVQVPSSNDEISFHRALCDALGLGASRAYKANDLRAKVESVLQSGDLLLVLDEGHYLWPQRNVRQASNPPRINWLLTQLVNMSVPVAIVTTPQFTKSQRAIERNGGWSSEQLIGRISLYKRLPDLLSGADLESVARYWLPAGCEKTMRLLVTYAQSSEKFLQGIAALARRSRFLARKAGRETPSFVEVAEALKESVVPSDEALAAALAGGGKKSPRTADSTPISGPLKTVCRASERTMQPAAVTTFNPPARDMGDTVLSP